MITRNGIKVLTLQEQLDLLIQQFKEIYGNDVIIEPNSPDGQLLNIFAQSITDINEMSAGIYNSFDPDKSIGNQQDITYKINGIFRKFATNTLVSLTVVVDRDLTLNAGFRVSDNNGNQFQLKDSVSLNPGTHFLEFTAVEEGRVVVTPNTITTFVDIIPGVVSVNNPTTAIVTGSDAETDQEFRTRRNRSTSIASQSLIDSMEQNLLNLNDVSFARVYENVSSFESEDKIPAHGIWAIVQGGKNEEIGDVINRTRNQGTPMKGDVSVEVPRPNGDVFTARFDRPAFEDIYIRLTVEMTGGTSPNTQFIKSALLNNLRLGVHETITSTMISSVIENVLPEAALSNVGVSINSVNWSAFKTPSDKRNIFVLSEERIQVNGE